MFIINCIRFRYLQGKVFKWRQSKLRQDTVLLNGIELLCSPLFSVSKKTHANAQKVCIYTVDVCITLKSICIPFIYRVLRTAL